MLTMRASRDLRRSTGRGRNPQTGPCSWLPHPLGQPLRPRRSVNEVLNKPTVTIAPILTIAKLRAAFLVRNNRHHVLILDVNVVKSVARPIQQTVPNSLRQPCTNRGLRSIRSVLKHLYVHLSYMPLPHWNRRTPTAVSLWKHLTFLNLP